MAWSWFAGSWPPTARLDASGDLVGVRKAEPSQHGTLARLHAFRLRRALMIMSREVQQAVHQHVRVVRTQALALAARLARHDRRTDHEVAFERLREIRKRKHVGRVVLPAEFAVQPAAFGLAHVADGHRSTHARGASPLTQRRIRRNVSSVRRALHGELHRFDFSRRSYASTIACTSGWRTTSSDWNCVTAMPRTPSSTLRASTSPEAWPLARATCVTSPVITALEPKPMRVRNIFICSGVVFCASSRMMNEWLSVRPRMKASGAISMAPRSKARFTLS